MALTKVSNSMLVQPVNHNILINPSFTVFQRAGTTTSGEWGVDHPTDTYGPDRWKVIGLNGVGGTMSQSSTEVDTTTGVNKLVINHLNATNFSYAYQFVEAVNLQGMYGKEMTFSFSYGDTGGSGAPKVRIQSWDGSDISKTLYEAVPTSLGNDRWTCTFILSTNDGTIPEADERGLTALIYANEGNTAPAEWSVWETKLEVGSVATPFIARSYGEELLLCQRYYRRISYIRDGQALFNGSFWGGSGDFLCTIEFPVEMRSAPTYSEGKNTSITAFGGAVNRNSSSRTTAQPSKYSIRFAMTFPVAFAAGNSGWCAFINTVDPANSWIAFEAEL